MSRTARRVRLTSRRSLSVLLAICIVLSMFLGLVFLTGAKNPEKVNDLNQSVLVQQINLLPVDPDVSGSRTTLYAGTNSKNSGDYSDITVNEDGSVDFTITADNTHNKTSTNNTSFVEAFTLVKQKINLAENPWLMVRWSGSGRCNGRLYFTVTYNGTEYGNKSKSLNSVSFTNSDGAVQVDLKSKTQQELISSGALFQLPLSNIINNNNAGYSYVNQTQTDFNAGTVADYSIDLYKYISDQVANGQLSLGSHWPTGEDWKDPAKYYITFYMSCQIIASEANQPLTKDTSIHWEQFAVGREVLNRPASLLPRDPEFMNITKTDGVTASDAGRVSKLDDGSVTFLNTSSTESVMFEWNLRRYFNATELEALHINADYSGVKLGDKNVELQTWFGGTTAYQYYSDGSIVNAKSYSYRGISKDIQDFVQYPNNQYAKSSVVTSNHCEVVTDFNEYLKNIADDTTNYPAIYSKFYPEDSLVFIDNLKLTIPAGGKITFTRLEFQVENEEIPATKADTVYPWVSEASTNILPPEGTPAVSSALSGAGISYDWATAPENAPIVKTKIDLLAMKTYSWYLWDEKTALSVSDGDSAGVAYTRKTDGSSIYSSSTVRYDSSGNAIAAPTQNSYYTIMRYGPDSNSANWNRNYYTYLDVDPAHTTTRTPYLYYSYELVDTTPNDGVEAQAGFYFHFRNAAKDRYVEYKNGVATTNRPYCYQYYLDHSGIALNECSSLWSLGYGASSSDDVSAYEYGAKAILSNTKNRTGCIDISSLWVDGASNASSIKNGEYLQLEKLRIYLAPGTEIKINYFFIGSESLDQSVIDSGTVPREGGEAFPWAITKEDFNKWTSPDSSKKKFTFANKVDLFKDIQDRAVVNNQTAAFPGATVDAETGAVTVEVTNNAAGTDVNTGFLKTAGISFDHKFQIQVAANDDLSSMRYLNYSVDAPAGMRWSIMFCEHPDSSTDQRAILTWVDADARFNDNDIMTAPPAGKALFRMATTGDYEFSNPNSNPEYDTYWKNQHNTSWRIYSIPGSQSGCIDLRQVDGEFEWNNIVSIYLVAYQDPNLVLDSGEKPEVTFNYMYLTSTPIKVNNTIGVSAKTPGTIYNWGNTQVEPPVVDSSTKKTFVYYNEENWGSTYPINYTINGVKPQNGVSVDLTSDGTPYLYYSYRLIDTSVTPNKLADLATTESLVSMWIIEKNTYYYQRTTSGYDSNRSSNVGLPLPGSSGTNTGYGKPSFLRRSTSSDNTEGSTVTVSPYYGYAAETGCINLAEYFIDHDASTTINQIRFVINNSLYQTGKYRLEVDYLFLGGASSSAPKFSQTYTPLTLDDAPKPEEYRVSLTDSLPVEIDLNKTPYLYYCREYDSGNRGTFSLSTTYKLKEDTVDANGQTVPQTTYSANFFRDASRTDGTLISSGTPTAKQYMLQSESGCIDVRKWFLENATGFADSETGIITVTGLTYPGDSGTTHYMYFGAKADKTIDLIPSMAAERLDNGLPTRTWVVPGNTANYSELKSPLQATQAELDAANGWDVYDSATNPSGSKPTTQIKFNEDLTGDGYNDLWITHPEWSQIYLRYGNIINQGNSSTFRYCSTGNNQMSGLMIDLNETPYLHFSFEQPEDSRTVILLQTTNNTSTSAMNGQPANKTRPWLSAFYPESPAGQLISILASTNILTFYKDVHEDEMAKLCSVYGDHGGVIDLRSWYSETNGYDNIVSLDSIRLYTYNNNGSPTNLKVNHLYLSSSSSAAYAVTFNMNDGSGDAYTQYVIQNANEQYVDDSFLEEEIESIEGTGYTFLGWYTDPECETYFDIQGTPLTGNLHLYARWLQNSNILSGTEINLLEQFVYDERTVMGSGDADFDNESLRLSASTDLTVRFPVGKAYNVEQLRALFAGFDLSKTCKGFDIIVDAKCSSSYEYSLIQDVFKADFLTANENMTAAPYDREMAFYTYLGINDDLPTRENKGNLIEINAVTLKVPAGASVELRYMKAAKELALQGKSDARAPAATASFDLLANPDPSDTTFVNKSRNVLYTELTAKSLTYLNAEYTQAAVHAVRAGHVHLGGLYNYTIDMNDSSVSNPGRYLYFSFDQPEDSYVTFALYTSFSGLVEGASGNRDEVVKDVYTKKAVSYYSAATNGLVAKDYGVATDSFVPPETAFVNGNIVGKIDLYAWYRDALQPYRLNSEVDAVKLLGVRLFTSDKSTDVNINYMFIGNDETALSKEKHVSFAEYPYRSGAGAKHTDSNGNEIPNVPSDPYHRLAFAQRGETMYVTLDQLTNLLDDAPITDPTKKFVGWVFRDIAVESLTYELGNANGKTYDDNVSVIQNNHYTDAQLARFVTYWNPKATNGNMYHPDDNPGGSWYVTSRTASYKKNDSTASVAYSTIDQRLRDEGILDTFVTDRKSVFYTFSTNRGNTQVIIPVFEDYQPTVNAVISGNGTVSLLSGSATATANANEWKVPYGEDVILRAAGANFSGWYDADGKLVTTSLDCRVKPTSDMTLVAKFGETVPTEDALVYVPREGGTIVWLQSTDSKVAGTNFYLKSINGTISYRALDSDSRGNAYKSNIDDVTGDSQIICYWNLEDSQMLTAVAPEGYHWEQLYDDGTQVRVSGNHIYSFIASTNIRLLCVADAEAFETTVIIDEVAYDDDRTNALLRFNGQVNRAEGDRVLDCGLVFVDYENHGELPSIDCGLSETITAKAWNSTTGQFAVEFAIYYQNGSDENGAPAYEYNVPCTVRGYAVILKADGTKEIVYSEGVATVF